MLKGKLQLQICFQRLIYLGAIISMPFVACVMDTPQTDPPTAKMNVENNTASQSDSSGIPKGCTKVHNAEKDIWELNCPEPKPPSPSISRSSEN